MIFVIQTATHSEFVSALSIFNLNLEDVQKSSRNSKLKFIKHSKGIVFCGGLGGKNALCSAQIILEEFQLKPNDICWIEYGTCGALDPSLLVSEVVFSKKVFEAESEELKHYFGNHHTDCFSGLKEEIIYCSGSNVDTSTEREEIFKKTNCGIASWESAALVQFSQEHEIEMLSLRVVTDLGNIQSKAFLEEYKKNAKIVLEKLASSVREKLFKL
jgi:nucleoside phosphorylase